MSQENLQTMIMQIFFFGRGGKRGVLWDCASSESRELLSRACKLSFVKLKFKRNLMRDYMNFTFNFKDRNGLQLKRSEIRRN